MGHGDELVIADGNFPAASCAAANGNRLIRADGETVASLLKSVMTFFPIDKYAEDHAVVMDLVNSDKERGMPRPPAWDGFQSILTNAEGNWVKITPIERMSFYERSKKAFAVIATSDTALYANLIIKKGVVVPEQ